MGSLLRSVLRLLNGVIARWGMRIDLLRTGYVDPSGPEDIFAEDVPENRIVHLYKLSHLSDDIRGMITGRAGEELFGLAYMQRLEGDVVEIGSYQGKSTFFLGVAVKLSGNGHMYAIDHFKGNKGKESFYVVDRPDLSDLESGFRRNMARAGLSDVVRLINEPTARAVRHIADSSVRLLFIDGDHSPVGVARDIELFSGKLREGATIVFDDYDPERFPGLVDVANDFIRHRRVRRKYLLGKTLVVEL